MTTTFSRPLSLMIDSLIDEEQRLDEEPPYCGRWRIVTTECAMNPLDHNGTPAMLTEALKCAAYGWRVLPVKWEKCLSSKDWPRLATYRRGHHQALVEPVPGRAISVSRPGKQSDLLVLDIDPGKGGDESLRSLGSAARHTPQTIEVLTGEGGAIATSHTPALPVGNSASAAGALASTSRRRVAMVVAPPEYPSHDRPYLRMGSRAPSR